MTLVVDASLVVAALIDDGPQGRWAESALASDALAAPHLMPAEATNILRRSEAAGDISSEAAAVAQRDLTRLQVMLFRYGSFANRIWELRGNLTPYDAWYVALAEAIEADLATLDRRLARAPGLRCGFATPP